MENAVEVWWRWEVVVVESWGSAENDMKEIIGSEQYSTGVPMRRDLGCRKMEDCSEKNEC